MDAWIPPALALLLSAALPFASARSLAFAYLAKLPEGGDERARRLAPFRRGALFAGLAQIGLAWTIGIRAIAPPLSDRPESLVAIAFGTVCAAVAFVAGGVARRREHPAEHRASAVHTAITRLRLIPFFAGPLIAALATAQLPLVGADGAVQIGWLLLAAVLCVLAVAYGGLLLSVATLAIRPASDRVARLCKAATKAEGAPLWATLRLPTGDARFPNAAALPWARTVIVTDRLADIADDGEVGAVLAHEAAHLSEGKQSWALRLGLASLAVFFAGPGLTVLASRPPSVALAMELLVITAGIAIFVRLRVVARRMEERADQHAAQQAKPEYLASALRKIAIDVQLPLVTGRKRIHPDLYDRLVALGEDPGPKPPAARGRGVVGLLIALVLVGGYVGADLMSDITPETVRQSTPNAAKLRALVDPWDGEAHLALGWHARQAEQLTVARDLLEAAEARFADREASLLLRAELAAADGDCDAARDAFEASLRVQADRMFETGTELTLGGYDLPPTLVRDCELTAEDVF